MILTTDQTKVYPDLPLEQLQRLNYSVYVIDYNWHYLFANTHAIEKMAGVNVIGKSVHTIWKENPNFNFEPVYNLLKESVDHKKTLRLSSRSPVTKKAIEIVGQPLEDCYYFSIHELPDRESILSELKSLLKKRK